MGPLSFREAPKGPNGGAAAPGDETGDALKQAEERILCKRCRHFVTEGHRRIEMGGDFEHVFFNPAGVVFRIGCFREAVGCEAVGRPSGEFTWFKGYKWRLALCKGCGEHLGWLYTGGLPFAAFFGLILDKLVREGSGGDDARI